jgi:hypothetical protein
LHTGKSSNGKGYSSVQSENKHSTHNGSNKIDDSKSKYSSGNDSNGNVTDTDTDSENTDHIQHLPKSQMNLHNLNSTKQNNLPVINPPNNISQIPAQISRWSLFPDNTNTNQILWIDGDDKRDECAAQYIREVMIDRPDLLEQTIINSQSTNGQPIFTSIEQKKILKAIKDIKNIKFDDKGTVTYVQMIDGQIYNDARQIREQLGNRADNDALRSAFADIFVKIDKNKTGTLLDGARNAAKYIVKGATGAFDALKSTFFGQR